MPKKSRGENIVKYGGGYRVYVKLVEYPIGLANKKSTGAGSITVVGHRYAEVRPILERALKEAFGEIPKRVQVEADK